MEETEVRQILSERGFTKIRKKYGQRYEPIISADREKDGIRGMRVWVHMKSQDYQTAMSDGKNIIRTHGNIDKLKEL